MHGVAHAPVRVSRWRAIRRLGSGAGRGTVAVLGGLLTVPVAVARGAGQAVERLEDIALGVGAMHSEMVGMREDLRRVDDGVIGLREELAGLRGDVGRVDLNTQGIDVRLERLGTSLESVDVLATRLGRVGRRSRGQATAPAPPPAATG